MKRRKTLQWNKWMKRWRQTFPTIFPSLVCSVFNVCPIKREAALTPRSPPASVCFLNWSFIIKWNIKAEQHNLHLSRRVSRNSVPEWPCAKCVVLKNDPSRHFMWLKDKLRSHRWRRWAAEHRALRDKRKRLRVRVQRELSGMWLERNATQEVIWGPSGRRRLRT